MAPKRHNRRGRGAKPTTAAAHPPTTQSTTTTHQPQAQQPTDPLDIRERCSSDHPFTTSSESTPLQSLTPPPTVEALLRDDDYDGHDQLDCFGAARDVLLFVGVVKGIVGNTFAMAITKNDKLCRFVDRASDGLASVWFVQGGELFIALRPPTDLGATLVSRMVKQHPFKYSGTAGEFSICKVVELSFDALDARANDVAHLLLCSLTADKEACSVVYDSLKQDAERA